jgi:hypothetical protein
LTQTRSFSTNLRLGSFWVLAYTIALLLSPTIGQTERSQFSSQFLSWSGAYSADFINRANAQRKNALLQTRLVHGDEERDEGNVQATTRRSQYVESHSAVGVGVDLEEQIIGHSCGSYHERRFPNRSSRAERAALRVRTHQTGARVRESSSEETFEACGGHLEVEVDGHSDCGIVWIWRWMKRRRRLVSRDRRNEFGFILGDSEEEGGL